MDRPADERANELVAPSPPEPHIPVATDGSFEPSVLFIVPPSVAGSASSTAAEPTAPTSASPTSVDVQDPILRAPDTARAIRSATIRRAVFASIPRLLAAANDKGAGGRN
jgi:hypothetical protein